MAYFPKTTLSNPGNYFSKDVEVTPMGGLRIADTVKIVGGSFANGDTTLDTNFWTSSVAGGSGTGTVDLTTLPGSLLLSTTAASNKGNTITSKRIARYVAGTSNMSRVILKVSAPNADNVRRWGLGSAAGSIAPTGLTIPATGCYWELDGTTFNIVTVVGSTPSAVAQASWNGNAFTLDTNFHTYEIYYTNKKIYWTIDDVLVHTTTITDTPWCSSIHLFAYMTNYNVASTTANTMNIQVSSVSRLGTYDCDTTWYYATTAADFVCKRGPGRLKRVISGVAVNAAVTLWDGVASGTTPIFVFNTNGQAGAVSIELDIPFNVGLTMTLANASQEITAIFE